MADPGQSYLIDQDGQVGAYSHEDAQGLLGLGYVPAGKSQIDDFLKEKAFHEKYGTTGQQAKTFGEGAAGALTFGLSDYLERGLGVDKEDIAAREKENPHAHLAGTITGVAAPLILSAGAAAPLEGAALGAEGAAAAGEAAEGASGALSALRGASRLTAPSLISRAGEAGSEALTGLLGNPTTALGRIGARAAASGAGSAIEGAAYGLGQVVHESALGDPNLTASHALEEVGLSALLGGGIGAGGGVLGKLVGEAAESKLGAKLSDWADTFEGNQNIKTAAGPGKGQAALRSLYKKMTPGEASKLGQEAGELGLVTNFSGPSEAFERANELMEKSGSTMGDILSTADANAAPAPIEDVIERAKSEILKPLEDNPLEQGAASNLRSTLDSYGEKFQSTGEGQASFKDLHSIRKQVSDKIYGLKGVMDPDSSTIKSALHDFRTILSDEINKGLEASNVDGASLDAWRQANRQYQVAATISGLAQKGMAGQGLSGVPLSAILTSGAGLIHGGPLGAAALGGATMLAKRFGPQGLATGARIVRRLVDDGAAEGLASKTAEAIAEARQAGGEVATATRAAKLWNVLGEKLEAPVVAPGQDLLRDVAKDRVGGEAGGAGEEAASGGTPVETVAALSQLERTSQRANNRINNGVSTVLKGTPRVARGEVAAGISRVLSQGHEDALADHKKKAEKIRQLASNPDLLQQKLTSAVSDLKEHAPQTAQAIQVALSRCVNVLNQSLPPIVPHAPLEKPSPPSPDQVAKFQRCYEAVNKPSVILNQAAAGILTPDVVQAVKAAHPAQYQAIQAAVLQKLASHKQSIPYSQRQMLGLLMGQDMDGTTTPAMIQASQATHTAQAVAEQQQAGAKPLKFSKSGMGKMGLGSRLQTSSQATSGRENE